MEEGWTLCWIVRRDLHSAKRRWMSERGREKERKESQSRRHLVALICSISPFFFPPFIFVPSGNRVDSRAKDRSTSIFSQARRGKGKRWPSLLLLLLLAAASFHLLRSGLFSVHRDQHHHVGFSSAARSPAVASLPSQGFNAARPQW